MENFYKFENLETYLDRWKWKFRILKFVVILDMYENSKSLKILDIRIKNLKRKIWKLEFDKLKIVKLKNSEFLKEEWRILWFSVLIFMEIEKKKIKNLRYSKKNKILHFHYFSSVCFYIFILLKSFMSRYLELFIIMENCYSTQRMR